MKVNDRSWKKPQQHCSASPHKDMLMLAQARGGTGGTNMKFLKKREMGRKWCTLAEGRWRKVKYRRYRALWWISGQRLCVEGPASGGQPQPTGPPSRPDVLQNRCCHRIQPRLGMAGIKNSFSATRPLCYAGLNVEAGWLDPQNEARPNVAPPASSPGGWWACLPALPVDKTVG